jgi:hypothetical protein
MYLVFDTESAGLKKETSLLTAYFAAADEDFNVISTLSLDLIPDNGLYVVEPQGLEVNKIDLVELASRAIKYKEAKTYLYNFLQEAYLANNSEKLIPIGQAIHGDIERITSTIISRGSWDQYVSVIPRDTLIIASFLQSKGKLPADLSLALTSLVTYFGIIIPGEAHQAKYDALCTLEVMKRLDKLC